MKKLIPSLLSLLLLLPNVSWSSTLNGFEPSFYGFIKASALYATDALASYNNINLSAPTHAAPQTRSQDEVSRMSFQTQQSRAGVLLTKGDVQGRLEFDFIDFSKSSPTTQMNPRVRVASVSWKTGDFKVIAGQDWDLFSPLMPYTFDYIGAFFLAGNTGFMRQQFQVLKTSGQWEWGGALGMAGNNPGTADSDLELAKAPSYAGRLTYLLEQGRMGISGIYADLKYLSNQSRHESYGFNLFFENNFSQMTFRSETYYGQNLANIGALSLGRGTDQVDVREYGANLTSQYKVTAINYLFGGVGFAKADNASEVPPFVLNASEIITSPGLTSNFLARVGWEKKITPDLSWINEVTRFETKSKLPSKDQLIIAYSLETGIQLNF
jgi:hypothetical protein